MSPLVRNMIRFAVFILVQVFVLFQIKPLHQFIVPYLYYLFILWLPFNTPRIALTFIGFLFGLTLDYFTRTPGLHAAPCTLIAYLRPFLVNILMRQDSTELTHRSPSIETMGLAPYTTFVFILTLVHHSYLVFLEWLQFGTFWYFIAKVLATTGVSLLLIMLTEMLFFRKERLRANTV